MSNKSSWDTFFFLFSGYNHPGGFLRLCRFQIKAVHVQRWEQQPENRNISLDTHCPHLSSKPKPASLESGETTWTRGWEPLRTADEISFHSLLIGAAALMKGPWSLIVGVGRGSGSALCWDSLLSPTAPSPHHSSMGLGKHQLPQDPEKSEWEARTEWEVPSPAGRKVIVSPNGKPCGLQALHEIHQPVSIFSQIREALLQPHPSTEDYRQSIMAGGGCAVFFSGVTTDRPPIINHPREESFCFYFLFLVCA